MRHGIATVCLSGDLREKMHAAARAGFDAVELFEPDLIVAQESPQEIRALAERLGIELALYQPMRDVEGVDDTEFARVVRRAEAKFALCEQLGMDLVLVCSNVATATIDSVEHSAAQLRQLAEIASRYGVRLAYEALAWGRHVDDYRRAWEIVEAADHPALGICLDSFHILSAGHALDEIARIPGERILFVQLADAPALSMDVLSWSRHHRLFPGEGDWDLVDFTARILDTGYTGPLSLEVFNDVYRQTPPEHTAVQARRSLLQLEDGLARRARDRDAARVSLEVLPPRQEPRDIDFVEITGERLEPVERLLRQLGMHDRGPHRSKPVRLWESGDARIILDEQGARGMEPGLTGLGFVVDDAAAAAQRGRRLAAPEALRRTDPGDAPLEGVIAPGGTEVFWDDAPNGEASWLSEFAAAGAPVASSTSASAPSAGPSSSAGSTSSEAGRILAVDHVNLTQSWRTVDAAVLFARSVLGLEAQQSVDVPSPTGLVASRVLRNAAGSVRLPLNVLPIEVEEHGSGSARARHIALRTDDAVALAERARAAGLRMLPVPANYYDDLQARIEIEDAQLERLRELDLLFDRDAAGSFIHFYTETVGEVFFEIVQRVDAYDGYGAAGAPVRLASQRARGRPEYPVGRPEYPVGRLSREV